jgi:hypothetical protein
MQGQARLQAADLAGLERLKNALLANPAETAALLDAARGGAYPHWLRFGAAYWAIESGLVPVLDWLRQHRIELDGAKMLCAAAICGRVPVLDWLDANGFASAESCRRSGAVMNAIAGGHLEAFDWFRTRTAISMDEVVQGLTHTRSPQMERRLIELGLLHAANIDRFRVLEFVSNSKFVTLDWLAEQGKIEPHWMGDIIARACWRQNMDKVLGWVAARTDVRALLMKTSTDNLFNIATSFRLPLFQRFSCPEIERLMLLAVVRRASSVALRGSASSLTTRENCLADGAKILCVAARKQSKRGRRVFRQLVKSCRLTASDLVAAGLRLG